MFFVIPMKDAVRIGSTSRLSVTIANNKAIVAVAMTVWSAANRLAVLVNVSAGLDKFAHLNSFYVLFSRMRYPGSCVLTESRIFSADADTIPP